MLWESSCTEKQSLALCSKWGRAGDHRARTDLSASDMSASASRVHQHHSAQILLFLKQGLSLNTTAQDSPPHPFCFSWYWSISGGGALVTFPSSSTSEALLPWEGNCGHMLFRGVCQTVTLSTIRYPQHTVLLCFVNQSQASDVRNAYQL